jgi:sulfur carrier protein ThiS
MNAQTLVSVKHMVLPGYEQARSAMLCGETIQHFIDRSEWKFSSPTICVLNGEPVLRSAWATTIVLESDQVGFLSKPWGGGQKGKMGQIIGLVAVIALSAFAPWAAVGLSSVLGLGLGAMGLKLLAGLLVLGGSLLISTLMKPKAGGQPEDAAEGQVDQVYSLSASGNTAKPLGTIPVDYGKLKKFPDYAAQPWAEFIGQDQYANLLLSLGHGSYHIHKYYIDDTVLWDEDDGYNPSYGDVQIEQYEPEEPVTLFPVNVINAEEVAGQELGAAYVGGFVTTGAGLVTTDIAVDIAFPAGLFAVETDEKSDNYGKLKPTGVTIYIEHRPVNTLGEPTGDWLLLAFQGYSNASRQPTRYTIKTPVSPGRYEVRVRRDGNSSSSTDLVDTVQWLGMRSFVQGVNTFPYTSTVAIRIKAGAQLSQASAARFGVLATRILPIWDGDNFVEEPTQNPLWAFYDAAVNTTYGARRPPSKVDFQTIVAAAAAADARGDTFNYSFSSPTVVPKAFDTILAVVRSKHKWSGDVLTIVRDEWRAVPQMLITDRQIVRGTVALDYIFNDEETSDAVIMEYLDESTWEAADVQYPPNTIEFNAELPARIRLDGITNREHATREAAFFYLQAFHRRIKVSFDTEHDGRILSLGSVIRVQTNLPQTWGSSGEVVSINGLELILSPAPEWQDVGQHYLVVRTKTGKPFGPLKVSEGVTPDIAVLDAEDLALVEDQFNLTMAEVLERMDGAEEASFAFGIGSNISKQVIVLRGIPRDDMVTLECVVDYEVVHSTSLEEVPQLPTAPLTRDPRSPLIVQLIASFRQGVAEPILDASWWPAAGAEFYVADVSYDSGTTWSRVYEGNAPNFSQVVGRAALRLRVAGVGALHGPFSEVNVTAPTIVIAPGTVAPSSLTAGLNDYVTAELKKVSDSVRSFRQIIASLAADQDAANFLDKKTLRNGIYLQAGGLVGQVEEVMDLVATIDGKLIGSWRVAIDINGYVSGIEAYNDGATSAFVVTTDAFQVASPGVLGGDPVPLFTVSNVGGVPSIVLLDTVIADGTITTEKMSVNELTAITANFGNAIVSGSIKSQNELIEFDFDNNQLIFSDNV